MRPKSGICVIFYSGSDGNHGASPFEATGTDPERGNAMAMLLSSIADWFGSLFGRKNDDYKSMLIADLGIER
jgi:hypothetical protein